MLAENKANSAWKSMEIM